MVTKEEDGVMVLVGCTMHKMLKEAQESKSRLQRKDKTEQNLSNTNPHNISVLLQVLLARYLPQREMAYKVGNRTMAEKLTKVNVGFPAYLADAPKLFEDRWKDECALNQKYADKLWEEKGN